VRTTHRFRLHIVGANPCTFFHVMQRRMLVVISTKRPIATGPSSSKRCISSTTNLTAGALVTQLSARCATLLCRRCSGLFTPCLRWASKRPFYRCSVLIEASSSTSGLEVEKMCSGPRLTHGTLTLGREAGDNTSATLLVIVGIGSERSL
jgi:hypothetical protein